MGYVAIPRYRRQAEAERVFTENCVIIFASDYLVATAKGKTHEDGLQAIFDDAVGRGLTVTKVEHDYYATSTQGVYYELKKSSYDAPIFVIPYPFQPRLVVRLEKPFACSVSNVGLFMMEL